MLSTRKRCHMCVDALSQQPLMMCLHQPHPEDICVTCRLSCELEETCITYVSDPCLKRRLLLEDLLLPVEFSTNPCFSLIP